MKFFAVILSLYLFSLILIPCMDAHAFHKEQTVATIMTDSQQNHRDIDLCSPFCYCTCCQSVFEASSMDAVLSEPEGFEVSLLLIEKNLSDTLVSLWRPPKIA